VRFAFIHAHARVWHVTTMCRVLQVSRAGYYAWRARPLCERVKDDRVLTEKIREIQQRVKRRYGSPRVHRELRALGFRCGKHRVARLMRAAGLPAERAVAFCPPTTQSGHGQPVAPNVVDRQFALASNPAPGVTWAGDCWDNAVVESFFATLTKELLGDRVFETRAAASAAVFEFIEIWYNRQRRHSTLGYLTPVEFEERLLKTG
jgi:transposase InsO family protein